MRVLVVGASGAIGTRLISQLSVPGAHAGECRLSADPRCERMAR